MAHILIFEDHTSARAGTREFLQDEHSIGEIGEAASGEEALRQLRRRAWDLLLMDLPLPDRTGKDLLGVIKKEFPTLPILVVSGLPEGRYAGVALRRGANGFVSKGGSR